MQSYSVSRHWPVLYVISNLQPSRLGKKYKDIKTKEWSVIMQNISTTANYKSSNIELCWERNDS